MWCRPSEIGAGATLRTLHTINAILQRHGIYFYESERTWQVPVLVALRQPDGRYLVSLGRNIISLTKVEKYEAIGGDPIAMTVEMRGRNSALIDSDYLVGLSVTGVAGLAELIAMTAQDTVAQGDSIIRDGSEVIIDDPADYSFTAGDMLASPPDALRTVAISIGNRVAKLELDEDAAWDDVNMNSLIDGWQYVLEIYT